MSFFPFLNITLILMKLFRLLLLRIFVLLPADPVSIFLYPMLRALFLQLIFSIPTTSLLIVFLKYSHELRDFCGFDIVPDASKFTRFKQDFLLDLKVMFDYMVELTEPICQKIDKQKASILLFDTSGIEAWVTENNPKYANRIIKQLKAFKKANLMIPMTPIKQPIIPCLHTPLPIPTSDKCM